MLKEDYLVRSIKEMVRTVLKLLFNIDIENPSADLLEDTAAKAILEKLLAEVDGGNIGGAENQIYDLIEDDNRENLKIALLFYSYLNEREETFLEEHDFSREEVELGIKDVITRCGLGSAVDIFFETRK